MINFLEDEESIPEDESNSMLIEECQHWGIEANKIRLVRMFNTPPEFHGPKADMLRLIWRPIDISDLEVDENLIYYKKEG